MRQAYDYWQDQPGNYPTGNPAGTLWPRLPFKGCWHAILTICNGNPRGQPRRTRRSICPADNHSIFATSFHYFTLVSFRHTNGTTMSRECQEDTSGKNDSSESLALFLAKGHQVQHPSVLSLTPSRQLGYSWVISCRQGSESAQHRSVLLNMPPFRTREHFIEQGLLIRTKCSSIAPSVFPDACPHVSTRNRVFPGQRLWT